MRYPVLGLSCALTLFLTGACKDANSNALGTPSKSAPGASEAGVEGVGGPGDPDAAAAQGRDSSKDVIPRDAYGIPLDAPVSEEARAQIAELMEIFRPINLSLTSDHFDRQIMEQREQYQKLIAAEPEMGFAALHAYTGAASEPYLVRRALLWVGGKTAPEEAENLLATLVETYGRDIGDRTEAALILAETSPARYMEIVRPYLERREKLRKTMPDDEFLVEGWVNACIAQNISPVPMLADVATNLLMMPNARYRAAKRMREFPNEQLGQRALETCLIESTGDNYLRIMSAQSLVKLMPRESACALFEETLAREASLNMAKFLQNMIQENCR